MEQGGDPETDLGLKCPQKKAGLLKAWSPGFGALERWLDPKSANLARGLFRCYIRSWMVQETGASLNKWFTGGMHAWFILFFDPSHLCMLGGHHEASRFPPSFLYCEDTAAFLLASKQQPLSATMRQNKPSFFNLLLRYSIIAVESWYGELRPETGLMLWVQFR